MKGLGGGRVRWVTVARVFGAFFGRPDGFGSSDFAQIVDFVMLYRSIWVSGAALLNILIFWPRKGRILRIWARKTSVEI